MTTSSKKNDLAVVSDARRRNRGLGLVCAAVCLVVVGLVLLPDVAFAGELIKNGSFESGDFGPYWVHGAFRGTNFNPALADHLVVPDMPYTGSFSARLGFKYSRERKSAVGFMYQDVSIPTDISSAALFFQVRQQGYDTDPYDPLDAEIRDTSNNTLETVSSVMFTDPSYIFKDSGWISDDGVAPAGFDLSAYAGQTIRVYFQQANTNDHLWETWAYVDDVSVIFKKFVDLAVDGNGDDEFGAIGSGLGGFSIWSALPGDTIAYDVVVENEGLDNDSYDLSVAPPAGWDVWLDTGSGLAAFPFTTPSLSPGETVSYRVVVVAPVGASAGSYSTIVDAVSTASGNRYDSVRLATDVLLATYGADLAVEGNGFGVVGPDGAGGFSIKTGAWDNTATYSIELANTGTAPTTFDMSWSSDDGAVTEIVYAGSAYSSPFTTQVIGAGATATMTLEVTVPSPEMGGDYSTIVSAAATQDLLKNDSIEATLRLEAPRVDMIVGSNGDGIYDDTQSGLGGSSSSVSQKSTEVMFPVTIQNEAGVSDAFTLTWDRPTGNWKAALVVGGVEYGLPYTTSTIPAHGELSVELLIRVPGNAKNGTWSSFLHAESAVDGRVSESVTAAVSITEEGQVDMIIDGSGEGVFGPVGTGLGGNSLRTIAPGDSVVFVVELQHPSGANAADISWNTPAGWRVTFDNRTSPVASYPEGVYDLKVVVPLDAPGGLVDIIVDAEKSDRRYYMDSVLGRLQVYPVTVVDAVIDGNGDGVYGSLGSGLGGSSLQTQAAPSVLNFTLELQNEGGDPDQYIVTWADIPFWNATLNSSSTPYTTGSIPAGATGLYTFEVVVPAGAFPGDYSYLIDVVAVSDPSVVESVEARITVVGPPRVDLVIDGIGSGIFGELGTGAGGQSVRPANTGASFTSLLDVRNVGSFADSFYVYWEVPAGWPAGSVVLRDGFASYSSPFWTTVIAAGGSSNFSVDVQVPADAGAGVFPSIINAYSSLPPNLPESVSLVAQTGAVVMGVVFDDHDHDGVYGPSDTGIGGVTVVENNTGLTQVTGGDGRFMFIQGGGSPVTLVEQNLPGFISLSPDTVGPVTADAGDTLTINFADVLGIRLSSGAVLNGVAGSYVDFPHRLDAGTSGAVTLSAAADSGVVTMFLLDENGNGVFDGADRALQPGDLDMDPSAGLDHLYLLLRVFVPMSSQPGTTHQVLIDAVQSIEGTPFVATAHAMDAALVVDGSVGLLVLQKQVDVDEAQPGDILTYTISYTNTGADSVQSVLILDPVSAFVDPMNDAFGAGLDVEWHKQAAPVEYLTLDPADGDECEYSPNERLLRVTFSRNSSHVLAPGETGELVYRVIVK